MLLVNYFIYLKNLLIGDINHCTNATYKKLYIGKVKMFDWYICTLLIRQKIDKVHL